MLNKFYILAQKYTIPSALVQVTFKHVRLRVNISGDAIMYGRLCCVLLCGACVVWTVPSRDATTPDHLES